MDRTMSNNKNIQYFIDHEQNVSREQRNSRDVSFRVTRCFCGCTALTFEQIENFVMMSVSALLVHATGGNLFRNFLCVGHRSDKSEALIHFECHELCANFMQNLDLANDQSSVDQLLSLCPSFAWEQKINGAFQSGQEQKIIEILKDLQQECVNSIECHNDYDRFRRELLRKIGKS